MDKIFQFLIENLSQEAVPWDANRSDIGFSPGRTPLRSPYAGSGLPISTEAALRMMSSLAKQHPNETYRLKGFPINGDKGQIMGKIFPKVGGNPLQEGDMLVALLKQLMNTALNGNTKTGRWKSRRSH